MARIKESIFIAAPVKTARRLIQCVCGADERTSAAPAMRWTRRPTMHFVETGPRVRAIPDA